jgi:aminoglycoside phosphotransferase (APT) family kinase protein
MTSPPLTIDEVARGLAGFARHTWGDDARCDRLEVMTGGHAGLTFGFEAHVPGLPEPKALILKLAPPGVRRSGNTDVYRQAPLLRALHAVGVPAPDVPYAGEGEAWFGTPFIMMERLAGKPFFIWDPDPEFDLSNEAVAQLWIQCIDALVAMHRFDWRRNLPDWEAPRPLREEIVRWTPILEKSPEVQWVAQGREVLGMLLESQPDGVPIGLVHGDFQPGNMLYAAGRLTGIVDWELASIGSRRLDAGWMMMLADPDSWVDAWRPVCPLTPADIAARYAQQMGEDPAGLSWHQALAGYRLGAISCLNVHLNRSGKRPDPIWERFALAVPRLFGRAREILESLNVSTGEHR